jgi:hypothetical protein
MGHIALSPDKANEKSYNWNKLGEKPAKKSNKDLTIHRGICKFCGHDKWWIRTHKGLAVRECCRCKRDVELRL